MLPPAPSVDEPVRRVIDALLPDDDVPDVKESDPEAPPKAFAVRTLNAPLDEVRPYPEIIEIVPPVMASVLSPALTTMRPPTDTLPLPTITLIFPPAPSVDDPVLRKIDPLLPFDVVPDENDNDPLVPSTPVFAVRTLKTPLDAARP